MSWLISLTAICGFLAAVARWRATLMTWTTSFAGLVVVLTLSGLLPGLLGFVLWVALIVLVLLNVTEFRRKYLSVPTLNYIRKILPPISATEREAIDAGTVWWEAELFRGAPDWDKLLSFPAVSLSADEQAFLDGPVEQLCAMLDDWQITSELSDLPEDVWSFMAKERFWAVNIPTSYGGLGFSPAANSAIVLKVASRSGSAGVTVMVPNSLGPAELLLHYGTGAQKEHYLPRLARGEEIPCFALTNPHAGSDAGAIPDYGVVCKAEHEGQEVLGIRVTWNKRYITLGPVATLLGLAFKAYDPDHLLGDVEELGMTCALIPTKTPGVNIGKRHYPLDAAFQNGPNSGNDVFIPMDWIIGGQEQIGKGWRMLMESLAAGRAISLPASGLAGAKVAARTTGAYARIREQFGLPIGRFEGVQEAMARIGGLTYLMDGARSLTNSGLNSGEKPSVISAIMKYHLTEGSRQVLNDAMDVHGGRGICMGPNNYLARAYQQIPIAITVEGANILTRSLIIFGQGAMRCHPYLLKEIELAARTDEMETEIEFDEVLTAHLGHVATNAARSLVYGLSGARLVPAPEHPVAVKYYRAFGRYSAALALLADVASLMLGGSLKRREALSGRFADVLSFLYLGSGALKHFADSGRPEADVPLLEWACQHCAQQIDQAIDSILRNFPNRWLGFALRVIVMPLGRRSGGPSDKLSGEVAEILMTPSESRDRLTAGIYLSQDPQDILGRLEDAMQKVVAAEPIRRRLKNARLSPAPMSDYAQWVKALVDEKTIKAEEAQILISAQLATDAVFQVDDFPAQNKGPGGKGEAAA